LSLRAGDAQARKRRRPEFGESSKNRFPRYLGLPLLERIHPEVPAQAKGGWDRSKLKPGISMRDELGEGAVFRMAFSYNDAVSYPPDSMPLQRAKMLVRTSARMAAAGRYGVRRVLYRLADVIQSSLVFVVEGERICRERFFLSRAAGAAHQKKMRGGSSLAR